MQKLSILMKPMLLLCLVFLSLAGFARVTLTATSGTATGSFSTLKGAFDAINTGRYKDAIVIKINSNTTETASATLTASAATLASAPYYTSVNIYPTTTGLSSTTTALAGVRIIFMK